VDNKMTKQNGIFEVGDIVELTKDQHISGRAGEWGKVYEVSEPNSRIAFLSIQLAGYSRDHNAFFAAATSVPAWQVKHRERKQK
jgi:hypothetical protein